MTPSRKFSFPWDADEGPADFDLALKERESVTQLFKLVHTDESLIEWDFSSSDELLHLLIRARRNKPTASLKLVKAVLRLKTSDYPELFIIPPLDSLKTILDQKLITVVNRSGGNDHGPAVLSVKVGVWNTSIMTFHHFIQLGFLYALYVTRRSIEVQRNGIVIVLDMNGFGFSHARQSTISNVTKLTNSILLASPFRIRSVYIINSPYIFEKVWSVVKYAIPERFREFVSVTNNDFKQLHDVIPPKRLPLSLGGFLEDNEAWEVGLEDKIIQSDDVNDVFYSFL